MNIDTVVNNFRTIGNYISLHGDSKELVYPLSIITRNKDNVGSKYNPMFVERIVNSYLITSSAQLERLEPEIKLLCGLYNARAYINLSRKSVYDIRNKMLFIQTQGLINHVEPNINKDLQSAIDSTTGEIVRWVVDVDDIDNYYDAVKAYFTSIGWTDEILEVSTVQGMHFVTPKFNVQDFKQHFPNIDVHKNSAGTLLYYHG